MKWLALLLGSASWACGRSGDVWGVAAPTSASAAAPSPTTPSPPAKLEEPHWPAPVTGSSDDFTVGTRKLELEVRAPVPALLTDVRAARHDGFDRVVFELGRGSPPGFHVEYIDRPVRKCGSGDVTPVAGDGWLEVRLEHAEAHSETGAATIPRRELRPELLIVRELEQTCDFEAQVIWVIGVSRPNAYRVLTLTDPVRLVVDVKH